MSDVWYYNRNGKQLGPVSANELKRMASAGDLAPTDLVWKEGMAEWIPADQLKGLFSAAAPAKATAERPERTERRPAEDDDERDERRRDIRSKRREDDNDDHDDRDDPEYEDVPPRTKNKASSFTDYLFFRRLVVPILIQIIFWLGIASCLIGGAIILIGGLITGDILGILGGIFGGLGVLVFGSLTVRVYCELLIVSFRINETLMDIKHILQAGPPRPGA